MAFLQVHRVQHGRLGLPLFQPGLKAHAVRNRIGQPVARGYRDQQPEAVVDGRELVVEDLLAGHAEAGGEELDRRLDHGRRSAQVQVGR